MVEKLGIAKTTKGRWVIYTGNPGERGKIIFARPQSDESIIKAVDEQNQKAKRSRKRRQLIKFWQEMTGAIMETTRRETEEFEAEVAEADYVAGEKIDQKMAEEGRKITNRFNAEEHIA